MKVINLFSGPGCGKSTTAAGVFHLLKLRDIKSELVTEFAKEVVWDQSYPVLRDQLYVGAQQNHKLFRLQDHGLEYAVTDSPILTSLIYAPEGYYKNYKPLVKEIFDSYDNVNILLTRTKKYLQYGRNHNEEEARELDNDIKNVLDEFGIEYKEVSGDEHAPQRILNILGIGHDDKL